MSFSVPPIRGLVFEGGSVKGAAFAGAIMYLQENKLLENVSHLAGSSAGAIIATALAIGFQAHEIHQIMMETDFSEFKDAGWFTERSKLAKLWSLIRHWGVYNTTHFDRWIGDLIQSKTGNRDITFAEVRRRYGKMLVLTGTNLTNRCVTHFSTKEHKDMPIRLAVRISMSIPLFFKPVSYEGCLYVDGGVLTNYPIRTFDRMLPFDCVVGFNLLCSSDSKLFHGEDKVSNIVQFVTSIANSCHTQLERLHISEEDWERTVGIQTGNVSGADFDIDKNTRNWLYSEGYRATRNFIDNREKRKYH